MDDLFEDEPNAKQEKAEIIKPEMQEKRVEELKTQTLNLNNFEEEAPVLPQEPEEDDVYDLQKELEAKFDELFGPIEEDN